MALPVLGQPDLPHSRTKWLRHEAKQYEDWDRETRTLGVWPRTRRIDQRATLSRLGKLTLIEYEAISRTALLAA